MTLTDRSAIAAARYEEQKLKDAGQPYSEAVLTACDMWLNLFPVTERAFIEMSLPPEKE